MSSRRGFSLIEIIVVLGIVALMFAIIIPYFIVSHRKAEAARVMHDLVALDAAVQRYALQTEKKAGFHPEFNDLVSYLDPTTDVFKEHGRSMFGDVYGPFTVDDPPKVPLKTADRLSSVVGDDFWEKYR